MHIHVFESYFMKYFTYRKFSTFSRFLKHFFVGIYLYKYNEIMSKNYLFVPTDASFIKASR